MSKQTTINAKGIDYPVDVNGFLSKRLSWTRDVGLKIAELDDVALSEEHWHIIDYFREYYDDYNVPPPMRMVVRVFKKEFGEQNANSRYLHQLFPGGPTRAASKFAGLPKPKNCK